MFWQTTSGAHGSAGRAEWLLQGKSLSFYQNRLDQRLRSEGAQGASGKPLLAAVYTNLVVKNPAGGLTCRLRRGWWGCRPEGGSTFFRAERKYQRKLAARRLQRRPTSLCTAAKPCAALGLGYALHGFQPFLALVGLRPPWAVGFGLWKPNGWTTRIYSGRPIPA